MLRFCLHFEPFWEAFWSPKSLPNRSQNRSKIKLRQHSPMKPLQEGPRPPQEAPRPPQEAPRSPQEPSNTRQEAVRDPFKRSQEQPQRPWEVPSLPQILFFSNVLNKLHSLIKICIGSFQEAIKKIQELPKINMTEPPSFQVSMPVRLQASECLPPSASAGFAKRKQFVFHNSNRINNRRDHLLFSVE